MKNLFSLQEPESLEFQLTATHIKDKNTDNKYNKSVLI